MKTKMTEVTEKICIWAIPKQQFEIEQNPHGLPFKYQFRTTGYTPYQDGATMVHEVETILIVPAGIDLLEKAVETLKAEIKKTRAEAQVQVDKLEKQIEGLLLLEFIPEVVEDIIDIEVKA